MKRKRRIRKPIVLILAFVGGCLTVPVATDSAYKVRGYDAVGGEILIPFLFVIVVALIYEFRDLEE